MSATRCDTLYVFGISFYGVSAPGQNIAGRLHFNRKSPNPKCRNLSS